MSSSFFPARQGADGNSCHSQRNIKETCTIISHCQKLGGRVLMWWFFHLWCASSWTTRNSHHPRDCTSQQDFGTWKVDCVSNITFHAEFKYAIKSFPSPTIFVQWHFLLLIFRNFRYFCQWYYYMWTNILNSFQQRVVTYNLPLSDH